MSMDESKSEKSVSAPRAQQARNGQGPLMRLGCMHLVYRLARAWREAIITMFRRICALVFGAGVIGAWFGAPGARAEEAVWYKPMPGIVPAPATVFGLYRGSDFRVVHMARSPCTDCPTSEQALWYFRDETIAVPVDGVPVADFSRGVDAQEDVRRWYASATPAQLQARPPLLWLGASHKMRDVKLTDDNRLLFPDGRSVDFQVTPKIKTNLSYYDDSSAAFFRQRPLRMRGELRGNTFTARTIWPQDWSIDEKNMPLAPLLADESLMSIVRRHDNAKNETYETRLLWERHPAANPAARDWSDRAVIGFILNGAQGDDDEAHGGHFAVVTGRHAPGGRADGMADWMVNNFYNLGSFSEKGITASMLPMDNYLADLNSGQSWYRPSYMLVAVLKSDRAAYAYQAAIARVYNHFYRNDFPYRHAGANCAGISMDTLRGLGWPIPTAGPTSPIKAVAAYPYKAITERSFTSGREAYDYLSEEQTRLYPAAAYDAAGRELLRVASGLAVGDKGALVNVNSNSANPSLEALLREDLEALVFVRIPQLPSSRAFGSFPVASYDEYMARVPADKAQWKIVPVAPRPFPAELRDGAAPAAPSARPPLPVLLGSGALLATLVAALRVILRRVRVRGTGRAATAAQNI